ncbi:MAG: hypothetical protein ACYC49_17670 [Ignavibacteriaceae bacterium]
MVKPKDIYLVFYSTGFSFGIMGKIIYSITSLIQPAWRQTGIRKVA